MIRAVTIDFWNTIVGTGNGEARRRYRNAALREALSGAGVAWDEEQVRAAMKHMYEEFERRWFGEQRTMSASESLAALWAYFDVRVDRATHEQVTTAFEDSILVGPPEPLPGAGEVIAALAERYALAVISDTALSPGRALRAVLARHDLERHFRAFVFSDETGVAKPHPKAFATALTALGVEPAEALHIGDIERTDVAGAKDAGMKAILFHADSTAMYFDADAPTRADAVAESWTAVPGIIGTLADVVDGNVA
ncbi:MAG: HAD family hydrolase [Ignavibacteria bacterium]|nr:HAD family hydrolase [Ignavibacteria bacterium]